MRRNRALPLPAEHAAINSDAPAASASGQHARADVYGQPVQISAPQAAAGVPSASYAAPVPAPAPAGQLASIDVRGQPRTVGTAADAQAVGAAASSPVAAAPASTSAAAAPAPSPAAAAPAPNSAAAAPAAGQLASVDVIGAARDGPWRAGGACRQPGSSARGCSAERWAACQGRRRGPATGCCERPSGGKPRPQAAPSQQQQRLRAAPLLQPPLRRHPGSSPALTCSAVPGLLLPLPLQWRERQRERPRLFRLLQRPLACSAGPRSAQGRGSGRRRHSSHRARGRCGNLL